MSKKNYKKILKDIFHEWKWLFGYMRKYWWSILIYLIIGVVAILMGLGSSVAAKIMIDVVIGHKKDMILKSAVLTIGLAVFQLLFNSISSAITVRVGTKVNQEIRLDFFNKLLHTSWEDISGYRSGDIINRLEGDVTKISSGIISILPSFITRTIQFLGAATVVFYYDKTMALIAIASAPVVMLTSNYMMRSIRKYGLKLRDATGEIISESNDVVQNLQMIKAFGVTKDFTKKFNLLLHQYRNAKLEFEKFSILTTLGMGLIGLIVSYTCYGWGVWQLWNGAISFGTMTLFIQLSGVLTNSFNSIVGLGPSVVSIATSAGRIMELSTLTAEEDKDCEEAETLMEKALDGGLKISAENLCFGYKNTEENVISNASFNITSGETIAIVGASGEGKTTMLRLILGLVHPTEGSIKFSAEGCKEIPATISTRKLCSYVLQVNSIICGTVAENLRLVKPDATDEELIEVLKNACAWHFVSKLPGGLNAQIGERNYNLSEGQAQRISIARALLRNSPVLLMDEATSSLDVDTENKVLKNIMKSDPHKICIITTHRPSMLKYCSRIFRINEDGSFSEYKDKEKEMCIDVED